MEEKKVEQKIEILTAEDVAETLKIGLVKAYELLKTGEIHAIRVGRRNIRTTRKALLEYIESGGRAHHR